MSEAERTADIWADYKVVWAKERFKVLAGESACIVVKSDFCLFLSALLAFLYDPLWFLSPYSSFVMLCCVQRCTKTRKRFILVCGIEQPFVFSPPTLPWGLARLSFDALWIIFQHYQFYFVGFWVFVFRFFGNARMPRECLFFITRCFKEKNIS